MALDCNLYPIWVQNVCFWLILLEICDFFWDQGLMLFDIPKDVGFPEILVLSNIFSFPAVNWTPKWTKTENFHTFESKIKLLTDFQNTVLALLENCLPSKLIQDIYLHKILHLTKSRGVKMSLKISFLTQFWSFLNTAIKIVEYLIHHLACEHWSKVQTKLKILGSSEAKKSPKSSLRWVSTGTWTFIWKLKTQKLQIRYC